MPRIFSSSSNLTLESSPALFLTSSEQTMLNAADGGGGVHMSRAARFTVGPMTAYSCLDTPPTSPQYTSPYLSDG